MNENPNCYKCKHYAVTWNPRAPKACRYFGFQSVHMPSAVVLSSTGKLCLAFEQKEKQHG